MLSPPDQAQAALRLLDTLSVDLQRARHARARRVTLRRTWRTIRRLWRIL
jgi:hypothetical protein